MITIQIMINGTAIATENAYRSEEPNKSGYAMYTLDNGDVIKHKPKDGARALAIKMLAHNE